MGDCNLSAFAGIRALILDFDGVLTDNTVTVSSDGVESVACWRSDGIGTAALQAVGIPVVVLSKERDPVVAVRCNKLGLPFHQGVDEKLPRLIEILSELNVDPEHTAYVGNDINDMECLHHVGLPVAVADAHPMVFAGARYVTKASGGRGAVREVCDLILEASAAGSTTD